MKSMQIYRESLTSNVAVTGSLAAAHGGNFVETRLCVSADGYLHCIDVPSSDHKIALRKPNITFRLRGARLKVVSEL
jgi:hypothetical protein